MIASNGLRTLRLSLPDSSFCSLCSEPGMEFKAET